VFLLDPELLRAHFCSKRLKYHGIFPEKIVVNNIIPNRDNSGMNYPLEYSDHLFAVIIYFFLPNKGSKNFQGELLNPPEEFPPDTKVNALTYKYSR